jgi:hypothetical protein
MTAEQRLAAFLQEGQGPGQDPDFSDAVMRRVARRELLAGLATSGVFAAAAAAVLWACAPALTALVEPVAQTLYPVAGLLACTAAFIVISQSLAAGRVRL